MPATLWTFVIGFFLLSGCYKDHLYVQQEWIDANFLASSRVGSPDPRKEDPPTGQRLLVSWWFPSRFFYEPLSLQVTVRFWDNTEEVRTHCMVKNRDWAAFYFPHDRPDTDCRILTYKIEVVDEDGCVVERWYHHFWTELIDVDQRSNSFY